MEISLKINGSDKKLDVAPWTTMLDLLRDKLMLTGTKKGCDHGQCGACTIIIDGKRVNSCLTLAVTKNNCEITTIEGIGSPENLHPMQQAFINQDAFQCGFCTSGQICSAVALMDEGHTRSDDEIREFMSGNLCRCGAYPNILAAIKEVMEKQS